MTYDLSFAVPGVTFQAKGVRVVSSLVGMTTLLVGGKDTTNNAAGIGILMYISIVPGASTYTVFGSTALPSFGAGVTALSQTSPLLSGYVLASTDEGVFKCAEGAVAHTQTRRMPHMSTRADTLTVSVRCRGIRSQLHLSEPAAFVERC